MTYKGIQSILAEFYKRLKNDTTFRTDIISKFSETNEGKLLYNGKEIAASSNIKILTKEEYDYLDYKDPSILYIITDDYNNNLNTNILEKFSETEDGKLLYNDKEIATSIKLLTRAEFDALTEKDESMLYVITDDNNTNIDTNVLEKLSESTEGKLLYDKKEICTIKTLTKAEYDALEEKSDETLYVITDEDELLVDLATLIIEDRTSSNKTVYSSKRVEELLPQSGVILTFAGETAPEGYLLCNGAEVLRLEYPNLFNVIGTKYGEGNNLTTFSLPNLKDQVNNLNYIIKY